MQETWDYTGLMRYYMNQMDFLLLINVLGGATIKF